MTPDAARSAVAATDRTPVDVRQLSGGDSAAAFAVSLDDGAVVLAKTSQGIAAEAASLRWLAEPGVVAVPEVFGHSDRWLVTEYIEQAAPTAGAAEQLGRGLADLHAAGAPAFGAAPPDGPADAWIGLAPMRNEPELDWPVFYAAHRVEPYLRQAVDSGALSTTEGSVISQVCANIDRLAGPAEPPARLHGDLWSGNVLWGRQRAWLIDPAAHGGHRETDLAMLHLFGCPHLDRVVAAYEETRPLSGGWRNRIALHQLFPLLVHTVLFGGGYAAQAVSAARSALRSG